MKGGEIMRDSLHVEILTPDRIFFEGDAESVTVRTKGGDRQILLNRRPFSSQINPGAIKIKVEGKDKMIAIAGGFINSDYKKVTIITHYATWDEEQA